ncbi:MAG: zf-HC2 domain-containing protein [Acidobacteriota bacterium]
MKCTAIHDLILRKIDSELSESENRTLASHLEQCSDCAREYGLWTLPSRIAQEITPPGPSPYFFQKVKARIEDEAQGAAVLQLFDSLARRVIPSMIAVTLALLSLFAYLHLRNPQDDLYAAYEGVFIGEDLPLHRMVVERRSITDASILNAIANQSMQQNTGFELKYRQPSN